MGEDDTLLGRSSERHSRVIKRRAKEEGKETEKARVDEDDELVGRSGGERRSRVMKRRAKRTPRRGSAAEREGRGAEARRTEVCAAKFALLFVPCVGRIVFF